MNKKMNPSAWDTIGSFVWECYRDAALYNEPRPITQTEAAQQVDAMRADGWEDLPDGLDAGSFCYWWNSFCDSCYIEY